MEPKPDHDTTEANPALQFETKEQQDEPFRLRNVGSSLQASSHQSKLNTISLKPSGETRKKIQTLKNKQLVVPHVTESKRKIDLLESLNAKNNQIREIHRKEGQVRPQLNQSLQIVKSNSKGRLFSPNSRTDSERLANNRLAVSAVTFTTRRHLRYSPKNEERPSRRYDSSYLKQQFTTRQSNFQTDRLSRNSSKKATNISLKNFSTVTPHRSTTKISSLTKDDINSLQKNKRISVLEKYKTKS